jgi:hypothetical protein
MRVAIEHTWKGKDRGVGTGIEWVGG